MCIVSHRGRPKMEFSVFDWKINANENKSFHRRKRKITDKCVWFTAEKNTKYFWTCVNGMSNHETGRISRIEFTVRILIVHWCYFLFFFCFFLCWACKWLHALYVQWLCLSLCSHSLNFAWLDLINGFNFYLNVFLPREAAMLARSWGS